MNFPRIRLRATTIAGGGLFALAMIYTKPKLTMTPTTPMRAITNDPN